MTKQYCRHIVLAFVLLALAHCSQNPVRSAAGGGGTETVYGMVLDPRGTAVADAGVYLYHQREIPSGEGAADSTVTDGSGEFRFVEVASGTYQIDVVASEANLRGLISGVVVDDAPVVLPPDTITAAATLTGWVEPQAPLRLIVGAAGSPYRATVDAQGDYTFARLPGGVYTLVVMVHNPARPNDPVVLDTQSVTVGPAHYGYADSIRYEPLGPPQIGRAHV